MRTQISSRDEIQMRIIRDNQSKFNVFTQIYLKYFLSQVSTRIINFWVLLWNEFGSHIAGLETTTSEKEHNGLNVKIVTRKEFEC